MELKPEPSRPAVLATGIIDGMPECAQACAAGMAPCRRTASQPEGLPTALLRPRRLGVTCDAVGRGAGVAVHDGGVVGPTSRRRKPPL
jgi:hypothetical protein